MLLLDTDVMVDLLRGHAPAVAWLEALDDDILLPGFVVMELLDGCEVKAEQQRIQRALAEYEIIWPSPDICDEALKVFALYHLSHYLGVIDALIGQLAVALNTPLHTFNQKHYAVIPGLQLTQPYSRK
jgi:predicted nucleic acid-binding protein